MADFLFVSQEMLDNWMMQGKIDFSGHVMQIRGDARAYVLEPAVRFVGVSGEEADHEGLLGKVKTLGQVAEVGGEHYASSVVVGEVAYDVQNGFVARVSLGDGASPPAGAAVAPYAAPALDERPTPVGGTPAVAAPMEASPSTTPVGGSPVAVAPPPEAPAPVSVPVAEAPLAVVDDLEDDAARLTRFLLENLR